MESNVIEMEFASVNSVTCAWQNNGTQNYLHFLSNIKGIYGNFITLDILDQADQKVV